MKVMWLCSWYPNRIFPFNGDFIKRHAEAVSLFEDVTVVHLVRDVNGSITKKYLIEEFANGSLREIIVYYYSSKKWNLLYDRLASFIKYSGVFKKVIKQQIETNGKPSLVHVHTGMNAGTIAYWAKKKFFIPYVVSEHWCGFLNEAIDNFNNLSFFYRSLWKKVLKEARGCSMVSVYLKEAMQRRFPFLQGTVIRNVVNTDVFFPAVSANKYPVFIHISTLSDFKRPEMILTAFQIFMKTYPQAKLEIFGPVQNNVVKSIETLNLKQNVSLFNEVPQTVLAEYVRKADALILYSSYETFGCVIIEANACGIPVIVTDIPVFHETVEDGVNGYFAKNNSVGSLAETMLLTINKKSDHTKNSIADITHNKYNYDVVGKQFSDWYKQILKN